MTVIDELFLGLPAWVQGLFWTVLVVILTSITSVVVLLVLGHRFRQRVRRQLDHITAKGAVGVELQAADVIDAANPFEQRGDV